MATIKVALKFTDDDYEEAANLNPLIVQVVVGGENF